MKRNLLPVVLFVAIASSGCATTERNFEVAEQVRLEEMLVNAKTARATGNSQQAIQVLKGAIGTYPAEKAPWIELAQLNFDASHYGQAIVHAEEALLRDPTDQLASSIVAVSGLRLSTKALADLSRQNNLSGSLRVEAQELAKLMRETLGAPILVPARSREVAPAQRTRPVSTVRPSVRDGTAPAGAFNSSTSNPFGALK